MWGLVLFWCLGLWGLGFKEFWAWGFLGCRAFALQDFEGLGFTSSTVSGLGFMVWG